MFCMQFLVCLYSRTKKIPRSEGFLISLLSRDEMDP